MATQSCSALSSANPALPGSVAFISPYKGARGGPSGGLDRAAAFAGVPSVSCPQMPRAQTSKFLHCLGGGGGGWLPSSHVPKSGLGFPFPFPHGAQREEMEEREAFEMRLPRLFAQRSPCAEPSHTPTVHLLATRQLFPFYDILGFRWPAKSKRYPLISRKKPKTPPSQPRAPGPSLNGPPSCPLSLPG